MGPNAIGTSTKRHDPRVEGEHSEAAEKTARSKERSNGTKKNEARKMNLDDMAKAGARYSERPNFGALASPAQPSIQQQFDNAIRAAEAESKSMGNVARAAANAHRALPNLSRSAEFISGTASGAMSVGNVVGAGVESIMKGDTQSLERAVDDVAFSGSLMAGELTSKIDDAKGIYGQFEKQYQQYVDTNRQYQTALRNRDYGAVTTLGQRKSQLTADIQKTVASLQGAVRNVGQADKRFEATTMQAAAGLALSATSLAYAGPSQSAGSFGSMVGSTVQDAVIHSAAQKTIFGETTP